MSAGRIASGTVDRIDRLAERLTDKGPPLAWTLRGYRRSLLPSDTVAGVTVAALIIPLSIGYAQVAGLPPEAGLYASLVPLLAYAILGSARRLIVGPDAATAALVGASVAPLAVTADERLRLASALALLVAAVFVAMRLASLGVLADLLSRPILVGYMTGVGIDVAIGQIPKILGGDPVADAVDVVAATGIVGVETDVLLNAIGSAIAGSGANLPSVILGAVVIAALLIGERLAPGLPVALVTLILSIIVTVALDLEARGVEVLGPVPPGLPPVSLPLISIDQALALLPGAVGIALLSFTDTALTGRTFASRHGEETEPDRELIALSAADLGASLTSGYPISASPSRTAAGENAGSRTQLSGIIAAGSVAFVLLFLTGPMAMLPEPALGAVILIAVLRFVNVGGIVRIWRLDRIEGAIAITATLGVVLYGTLAGVAVAVALAAVNVFRRAASPRIEELGRLSDGVTFASLRRNPQAERVEGLVVVRFAGPLFFATSTALLKGVRSIVAERSDPRVVVLDASAIVDLDLTAADEVRRLDQELGAAAIEFVIARPTGALRDLMRNYGLADLVGDESQVRRTIVTAIGSPQRAPSTQPVEDLGRNPEAARAPLEPAPAGDARSGGRQSARRRAGLLILGAIAVAIFLAVAIFRVELGAGSAPPPGTVAVPNLVGQSLGQARISASSDELVLGDPTFVKTSAAPDGTVIRQDPAAGTHVAPGTEILPVVSTTRELIAVPDLVGLPQAEAIVALSDAGLRVGDVIGDPSRIFSEGAVVVTFPPPGSHAVAGSSVDLVVSTGDPDTSPTVGPSPQASSS